MTNTQELTQEQKLAVMALREEGMSREDAIAEVTGEPVVEHVDMRKKAEDAEFIEDKHAPEPPAFEGKEEWEVMPDDVPDDVPEQAAPQKQAVAIPRNYEPKLTMEEIKKYVCPSATDAEAYTFLQLCTARHLNPFTKEAYLIKYGNTTNMVVGKDAFTRKAEDHPAFDGFEAGIIVKTEEGTIDRREGCFKTKGESLLGGWSKVYRNDRSKPYTNEVAMEEYSTGKSNWIKMPSTMIRKVALVQSLREAFPSELGGCYDSSEMGGEQ